MAQNVSLIGIQPEELPWIRLLISLLRHPDPKISELARQAVAYVAETAGDPVVPAPDEPAVGYRSAR